MRKDDCRASGARHLMWLAVLAMIVAAGVAGEAWAGLRAVKAGESPQLDPGEGLLLVGIDSSYDLDSIWIRPDGRLAGSTTLRGIKSGRTARLFVAGAGHYRWADLKVFGRAAYRLDDDDEYRFEVRPGVVNYAGELVFRPLTLRSARIQLTNRGLQAIDWLQEHNPEVWERREFVYSGHYPDPFPAFYRGVGGTRAGSVPPLSEPADLPIPDLPIPIRELWRPGMIDSVALNNGGDLLALSLREPDDGKWAVDLFDLRRQTRTRIATSPVSFDSVQWAGPRELLVGSGMDSDRQLVLIVRIGGPDSREPFELLRVRTRGHVVDALPENPDAILFASTGRHGGLKVHRVDISSQQALDRFSASPSTRINRSVDDAVGWYADGRGRLRVAVARREEALVILHGDEGGYREVLHLEADSGFQPLALSRDGDVLYALSDDDRAQRDLVAFDLALGRTTGTLFSKPGVDMTGVLLDRDRRPIGASYYQGGQLVNEYFERPGNDLAGLLAQAFPDRTVAIPARSAEGRDLVLWVDGSDRPPQLYHLDVASRHAVLLEESRPWLASGKFVPSRAVRVPRAGGVDIEAFLTLPPGRGRPPMVVLPHGGPIEVSDKRHFDPGVQFLAALGYAVLQVNYRGSDGYGKAFRDAGKRGFGTLIEDDIDAAIAHVLAAHPIDRERICLLGTSYGGYSTLMSLARWPGRFRCAVSIAGPSDLMLQFTASDTGRLERGRRTLEEVIGDPATEAERLVETSPVYRYRGIQQPVMLVHGREDRRVDDEHTRRMSRMLQLDGRPPVVLELDDEGHGIHDGENIERVWTAVAAFLRQHLSPVGDAAGGASTAAERGP